ncbi:MAG: hypothetical protein ACOZQL_15045 [Myxococcota bacterium]
MLTALALMVVLQADVPREGAGESSPPPQQFSEAFRRRRAWEAEQRKPSWKDHVSVAVGAYGGAALIASSPLTVAPSVGLDLELGGKLTRWLSLVGLAQGHVDFVRSGVEVVVTGFGAGLRLGERHFITLGGGAAITAVTRVTTSAVSGLVPTFDLRGGVLLVGGFGIHLRLGAVLAPTSPLISVGLGFGYSH